MKRLILSSLICLFAACVAPFAAYAQGDTQEYRSDELGVAFQYPAAWVIRQGASGTTVITATQADLEAIADGRPPENVIFSLTVTSLRLLGINNVDDLTGVLVRLSGGEGGTPQPFRLGNVAGVGLTQTDAAQNIATFTAVLSIGARRVAIVRGAATLTAWRGGGEAQFNRIAESLSFFPLPPGADIDGVGAALWQTAVPDLTRLADLSVSPDGTTIYATDYDKGIAQINANGKLGEVIRPAEIGAFAGVITLLDGNQYLADPAKNTLWLRAKGGNAVSRVLGGKVGTGRGAFGEGSPKQFAIARGSLYVLDENTTGIRIQVFALGGSPVTFWPLADEMPAGASGALMVADSAGNLYVIAKGMAGFLKLNAAGGVVARNYGADALNGGEVSAVAIDRFNNLYIATTDQGILHLDAAGKLDGIIGQPYDESAPPKPGQLGRPVAIALDPNGGPMYVADAGKYPQIVAFALDGNTAVNLEAGTQNGGPIKYNEAVESALTETAFFLLYTFEGQAGERVSITVKANGFDAYVDLLRPDGKVAAYNDDLGAATGDLATTDSQIAGYTLPKTGQYTIRVTRFGREAARGPNTTGTFILRLEGSIPK